MNLNNVDMHFNSEALFEVNDGKRLQTSGTHLARVKALLLSSFNLF